jgi:hypothetical protein
MKIVIDMRGPNMDDIDGGGEILSYVLLPRVDWVVQLLKYGVKLNKGEPEYLLQPRRMKKELGRTFYRLYDLYFEEGKELDRKEFTSRFPGIGKHVILDI